MMEFIVKNVTSHAMDVLERLLINVTLVKVAIFTME